MGKLLMRAIADENKAETMMKSLIYYKTEDCGLHQYKVRAVHHLKGEEYHCVWKVTCPEKEEQNAWLHKPFGGKLIDLMYAEKVMKDTDSPIKDPPIKKAVNPEYVWRGLLLDKAEERLVMLLEDPRAQRLEGKWRKRRIGTLTFCFHEKPLMGKQF